MVVDMRPVVRFHACVKPDHGGGRLGVVWVSFGLVVVLSLELLAARVTAPRFGGPFSPGCDPFVWERLRDQACAV